MAGEPLVSAGQGEFEYRCDCGWIGPESALEDWAVQRDRDRVVRVCPDCGRPVPEWGALRPIDGVAKIAEGDLHDALVEQNVLNRG